MGFAVAPLVAILCVSAPYVDTKGRFELDLPSGWRLLPAYGDTFGMRFQRELAGGRVSLTVHVDPVESEGLESFITEISGWVLERGLEQRGRAKAKVGSHDAVAIDFASSRAKDAKSATRARSYFVEDRGHRYHLHVSASPPHVYDRASSELRAMLASFAMPMTSPSAGRDASERTLPSILGGWRSDKGVSFHLGADGRFTMGGAVGRYLLRGETLSLMVDDKAPQVFRVELSETQLLLHSERLAEPAVYRRAEDTAAAGGGSGGSTSALVGRWRATIPGGTLELTLEATGRFILETHRGRWVHDAGLLSLTTDEGEVIAYAAALEGGKLNLSGGDLEEPLWLQKISAE